MKNQFSKIMFLAGLFMFSSCEYDNFAQPESSLTGNVVYDGDAMGVRNNGPQLELWEDGHALKTLIPVFIRQDGSFSASLFDGEYKLVRKGDSPWLPQFQDTILIKVNGDTKMDIPMTPYFALKNVSFQRSANKLTASFTVNKVVETANLDNVRLFMSGRAILDQVDNQFNTDLNPAEIKMGAANTYTVDIPENLAKLDGVFVRVGLKSNSSGEYSYSQVQKLSAN